MKKKTIAFVLVFAFAIALAGCGGGGTTPAATTPAAATPTAGGNTPAADTSPSEEPGIGLTEKVKIRLAHDYQPNSANYEAMAWFVEELSARSGGMIEVDYFPAGELSGQNSQVTFQLLQTGDIDMSIVPPPNTNEWQFFYLPFMFRDVETALKACREEGGQMMLDLLESSDVKGLSYLTIGMRAMTNSKRPLNEPEDMRGLAMRVLDVPAVTTFITTLGGNPVPLSMGELYMALQQGTVDGQENPLDTIYNRAMYEVQDYLSITNHIWSFAVFGANLNFWNGLPEAAQELINELSAELSQKVEELAPGYHQAAYDNLKDLIEINEITDEQWYRWQEAVMPVHQAMEETITPEILEAFYKSVGLEKTW